MLGGRVGERIGMKRNARKIELKCKIVGLIGRPLRDTAVPYTLESPFHDKHFVADSSLLYITLLRNYKASKLTILMPGFMNSG